MARKSLRNATGKNKKQTRREFVRRKKDRIGNDRYKTALICANYRNLFYNALEQEKLTPIEMSLVLWASMYDFFSRKAALDKLRVGKVGLSKAIRDLQITGHLEVYSPAQFVTQEFIKTDDILEMTYTEEKEVRIEERYRLTRRGTQLAFRFFDDIDKNIVDAFKYDDRDDTERMRYL